MDLSGLQVNIPGIITKIKGRSVFRERLKEKGLRPGDEVYRLSQNSENDTVEVEVNEQRITLTLIEARMVEIVAGEESVDYVKNISAKEKLKRRADRRLKQLDIRLVGNPGSGLHLLLDHLSRQKKKHNSYPEKKSSISNNAYQLDDFEFTFDTLPETYSLFDISDRELNVCSHFYEETPDVVINILDSSNLEKHLFLTTQLIDLGIKVIIALNTYDELLKRGDKFDHESLAKMMGTPIVPVNLKSGYGIKKLLQSSVEMYLDKDPFVRHVHIGYGKTVEKSINILQDKIRSDPEYSHIMSSRYLAIKLLEGYDMVEERLKNWPSFQTIKDLTHQETIRLKNMLNEESVTLINGSRHGFISGALKETYLSGETRKRRTETIDSFMTHRLFGYPIFLVFMVVMFFSTFEFGQYPMDWLDAGVNTFSGWLYTNMAEGALKDLIINGIIGGVGSVLIFLPNILILFFFISLMEDTGYMARAAFIMDKVMHKIGLHGRSFIPLLMGFGCNVPAIMATHSITNRNNRILTILINPFMSCSARLPVYILLIGAFFPNHPGLVLILMYFIGIVLATIIAIIFKKIFFKTEEIPYVMELPPYRVPSFQAILIHMWQKSVQYLKKMGGIILIASVIIWALGYYPKNVDLERRNEIEMANLNEQFEKKMTLLEKDSHDYQQLEKERNRQMEQLVLNHEAEKHEKSFIGRIGHFIEPVLKPLGFDWKMGVSLLSGIAAKEIVVSTMGVLYQAPTQSDGDHGSLINKLRGETSYNIETNNDTGFTPLVAFAFMVFILTYFPCVAVIAAIRKETGSWKWALFTIVYTTLLAWALAFIIYQGGKLLF